MTYEIIASGSDGNATLIDGRVLIDVGIPYKEAARFASDLLLVLTTHLHGDHFNKATVKRLAHDRPGLRWGCCEWMVGPLLEAGVSKKNIDVMEPNGWYTYSRLGMLISPAETHHNVRNCAWRLWRDERDSLLYATDLGDLDGIEAKAYTVYLLEANHTQAEIEAAVAAAQENGEYSYRIRAAENHLSQEQAVDWLTENMAPWSVWVPMHQHKERREDIERDPGNSCGAE